MRDERFEPHHSPATVDIAAVDRTASTYSWKAVAVVGLVVVVVAAALVLLAIRWVMARHSLGQNVERTERLAMTMAEISADTGRLQTPADAAAIAAKDGMHSTDAYGHGFWIAVSEFGGGGWVISLGADGAIGGSGRNTDISAMYATNGWGGADFLSGDALLLMQAGRAVQLPGVAP